MRMCVWRLASIERDSSKFTCSLVANQCVSCFPFTKCLCVRIFSADRLQVAFHHNISTGFQVSTCSMLLKEFTCQFLKHTVPCRRHLTPELVLRLVTPACPLWSARPEDSPFTDPFWGFYWPGGQASARYILDNTEIVRDRRVLDVGCGCGASAIAAAVSGARRVVANDIDPYAVLATKINAKLNNTKVEIDTNNFIGRDCKDFDVILIGDMFYDEEFASILFEWLHKLTGDNKLVLIGDPGRHGLSAGRRRQLAALAHYELTADTRHQNNGFTHATLWRMTPL